MSGPKKNHGPEHEEGWLMSYADLVTVLMFFFLVLWNMADENKIKMKAMSDEIAQEFNSTRGKLTAIKGQSQVGMNKEVREVRALQMLVAMLNLGDNMDAALKNIEQTYEKSKDQEKAAKILTEKMRNSEALKYLESFRDRRTSRVLLPENLLFVPGTSDLTPESRDLIVKLANQLKSVEDLVDIEVIGHTDSRPPKGKGIFKDNWSLSSARAGNIARLLAETGVKETVLKSSGVAASRPLYKETNPDGSMNEANMARNRRVEIILNLKKKKQ